MVFRGNPDEELCNMYVLMRLYYTFSFSGFIQGPRRILSLTDQSMLVASKIVRVASIYSKRLCSPVDSPGHRVSWGHNDTLRKLIGAG